MFFCLNAKSQTATAKVESNSLKVGLSKEELATACDKYIKMVETDTYFEKEKKVKIFAEKTEYLVISENAPFDSIKNKALALKFISNNIKKTKFKSIAEAELCMDEMFLSQEKEEAENKLLYELLSRATPEQIMKISQPFFDRVKSSEFGHHKDK